MRSEGAGRPPHPSVTERHERSLGLHPISMLKKPTARTRDARRWRSSFVWVTGTFGVCRGIPGASDAKIRDFPFKGLKTNHGEWNNFLGQEALGAGCQRRAGQSLSTYLISPLQETEPQKHQVAALQGGTGVQGTERRSEVAQGCMDSALMPLVLREPASPRGELAGRALAPRVPGEGSRGEANGRSRHLRAPTPRSAHSTITRMCLR